MGFLGHRLLILLLPLVLSACALSARHPVLREASLPALIPVHDFMAEADYGGGYRISPDGQQLLWTQITGRRIGLAVRGIEGSPAALPERRFETGQIASWSAVGIAYNWLSDSRHVMYVKDVQGDEDTRIFVFDAADPDRRMHDLTPWPHARSLYVAHGAPGSARFFFKSNRRVADAFDLYEADAAQLSTRLVMQSNGDVIQWLIDIDGRLGGRIRLDGSHADNARLLEILDPVTGAWRVVRRFGAYGYLVPLRLDRAAGKLVANSGIDRETTALVEIDLVHGRERELFRDVRVDLTASYVQLGATQPYAVQVDPGYPEITYFDAALADLLRELVAASLPEAVVAIGAGTADRSLERMIVRPLTLRGEREYLLDRPARRLSLLKDVSGEADLLAAMAPVEPIRFLARDGLVVHGFLLRPLGASGPVPLVVMIHGGPWLRDYWAPSEPGGRYAGAQLLANRGYAVLHVNYRGSTGYGGRFMYAAVGELAGRTQQDIEDGVRWAIEQGIADPAHIGLLGDSFGGFSVLSQMTKAPERYACGVNIVGIANWERWLDAKPAYWRNTMHWWNRFLAVGSPLTVEERERLREASPLSHINALRAPLLVIHGANDVRVARQDSDDVVAALQRNDRSAAVEYLLFADEGHAIRKWRNRLRMWRAIEDFYAACLGGRSSGFDIYQLLP